MIATTKRKDVYVGNGQFNGRYDITFPFDESSDLTVTVDGVAVAYSFHGADTGGPYYITTPAAYSSTQQLIIERDTPPTNPFAREEGGKLTAKSIEQSEDRIAMAIQDARARADGLADGVERAEAAAVAAEAALDSIQEVSTDVLKRQILDMVSGINNYAVAFPSPTFASAPAAVTAQLLADDADPSIDVTVIQGSITASGVTIEFDAALPSENYKLYYEARLTL